MYLSRFCRKVIVISLVACGAMLNAPLQAQDKLALTIAHGNPPAVPTSWWFKEFIGPKLVEYSKGRISVNVQGNGGLCTESSCVEQVRLGQIDIAEVSAANVGGFGSTFDILNLPYLFKDQASAEKLINGWLGDDLSKRAEKELGLHVIAIIPSFGFRELQNSKREVRVPGDLKGLKIRVTKTPVELMLVKTWGAIAVPYDWSQLYEGLQNGVVDGMYIPDAYVSSSKFYEVTKFITAVGGTWSGHIIFMDKKRYDKLPDWTKDILARIGKEMKETSFKVDAEWTARAVKILEGKVKYYNPDAREIQLWYAGATGAWGAVKGTFDHALARRALQEQNQDSLIKKLAAEGAL